MDLNGSNTDASLCVGLQLQAFLCWTETHTICRYLRPLAVYPILTRIALLQILKFYCVLSASECERTSTDDPMICSVKSSGLQVVRTESMCRMTCGRYITVRAPELDELPSHGVDNSPEWKGS